MRKKRILHLRTLPLLRYLLPALFSFLLTVSLFIPSMRFTVSGEKPRASISLWELMSNAFASCRTYLFSSKAEKDAANDAFAPIVFGLVILLALLYLIGVIVSVWSLICAADAARCTDQKRKPGKMRKVFLTLIPNRTVALILQGLCLPLTLFPLMLIFFYERYLFLWVNLSPTIPISFWIGLAFFAANAVLTIISRDKEILCGINPFSKAAFRPHAQAQEREEEVKSEDTSTLYRMQQASAAEQAERLRRLLGQEEDKE